MLSKYLKVVDAIIILFQVSEYRLRVYNTIFRRGLFLGPVRGNQVNNDFFSLFSHIMSFVPLPDWVVEYIIDIIDEARSYFLTSSVGHRKEK